MPDINDLIDSNNEELERAATDVTEAFLQAEDPIVKRLVKLLSNNATKGRLITDTRTQATILASVLGEIEKALLEEKIPNSVQDYVREFDNTVSRTKEIQDILNGVTVVDEQLVPLVNLYKQNTVTALLGQGLNQSFVEPVKNIIVANLMSGATINDAEFALRNYISGNAESVGALERYVQVIARDTIFQLQGNINAKIALDFNMNAIRYVGSVKVGTRKTLKSGKKSKTITNESRPQCKRWVGLEVILLTDLQAEIDWAYKNGSGMIPGTTPSNFTVYRGGYNCRHEAIPFIKK